MTRIVPPSALPLQSDAAVCAALTRAHARTFSLAAALLARDKRRGAFAVYAFCRLADDIVDGGAPYAEASAALAAHRAGLRRALEGRPNGAVFRELAWAVERFGIPGSAFDELLAGVASDLTPARYTSTAELDAYCEAVAGSVGEMCAYVLGVAVPPVARVVHSARTLGVAMQLTNILRDVGEDARRGRCYLPDETLAGVGLTRDDVLAGSELARDPRWRSLMRRLIEHTRGLYRSAESGVRMLAPDARACARACARGYALILDEIERQAYDTLRARAVVPGWRKACVLLGAWRPASV